MSPGCPQRALEVRVPGTAGGEPPWGAAGGMAEGLESEDRGPRRRPQAQDPGASGGGEPRCTGFRPSGLRTWAGYTAVVPSPRRGPASLGPICISSLPLPFSPAILALLGSWPQASRRPSIAGSLKVSRPHLRPVLSWAGQGEASTCGSRGVETEPVRATHGEVGARGPGEGARRRDGSGVCAARGVTPSPTGHRPRPPAAVGRLTQWLL